MEHLLWGRQLQLSRKAAGPYLSQQTPVLLLGDGDGRFSCHLHQQYNSLSLVSLEVSSDMNRHAMRRRQRLGLEELPYTQIQEDLRSWTYPKAHFASAVIQFVLDSLSQDESRACAQALYQSIRPGGLLIITDFTIPEQPWSCLRGKLSTWLMFRFFRFFCRLRTKQLYDYWTPFSEQGFISLDEQYHAHRCIRTQVFQRP